MSELKCIKNNRNKRGKFAAPMQMEMFKTKEHKNSREYDKPISIEQNFFFLKNSRERKIHEKNRLSLSLKQFHLTYTFTHSLRDTQTNILQTHFIRHSFTNKQIKKVKQNLTLKPKERRKK